MRADLDDPLVLPRGLDHRPALGDRHREWLLDIYVLACLAGGDHLDRVPVVGRGDHDSVDILAIEDRAEILDARHIALELGHLGNTLAQTGESGIESIIGLREGRAHRRRTKRRSWRRAAPGSLARAGNRGCPRQ